MHFLTKLGEPFTWETKSWLGQKGDRGRRPAMCVGPLAATCRAPWPVPTSIFARLWPTRTFWRGAAQGWRFPSTAAWWKRWTQQRRRPCSSTLWTWRRRRGEGSDTGLFVVQPLAKLWENYASCLDRCFVLADRPQGTIYTTWSGNSQTGRLQGVLVRRQKAQVERDVSWRRAIDWAMSDFALRCCPIFLAEILAVDGEDVVLAPLRGYTKDAPTILCASTRPCELHANGPNLQELLPPTRVVEWA